MKLKNRITNKNTAKIIVKTRETVVADVERPIEFCQSDLPFR
jgi:hypothetical protein